ncbi:hypothetical protein IJG72_00995 [bacterium]|nr:hypothetical protein [bacterium]
MFKNLKSTINDLAYAAVNYAEKTLTTSSGKAKKLAAVNFVVNRLPVVAPIKQIVGLLLNKFIDSAIEKAVKYMNEVRNEN